MATFFNGAALYGVTPDTASKELIINTDYAQDYAQSDIGFSITFAAPGDTLAIGTVGTLTQTTTFADGTSSTASLGSFSISGVTDNDGYVLSLASAGGDDESALFYISKTDDADINDIVPYSTEISPPVCFTRGTLISTPNGQMKIEVLQPGDLVSTLSGPKAVKWVGWRNYGHDALSKSALRSEVCPIRIKSGALGDGTPSQDIMVSPWHHLYIDSVLIRAMDLVNGITIVQETGLSRVEYMHIELETFDVVLAHGIYSESWADGGNRDFFQNADVTRISPEDRLRRRAPRPGFKVVRPGDPLLVAVKQRLDSYAAGIQTRPIKAVA